MPLPAALESALTTTLAAPVLRSVPVGGGCIHHGCQVETGRGPFFLKYNGAGHAANFAAEAQGLARLAQAGTLPVPQVQARGEAPGYAWLLMDYVPPGRPGPDYWETLGAGLARLHQVTAPRFGLDHDNYIGSLPQANGPAADWSTFFITRRIAPLLKMALDRGAIGPAEARAWDALSSRLPSIFPDEPPALLHGDLWGGNLLCNQAGQPVLIDPAVYYGHREAELAFMTLFDRQPPAFYAAYEAVQALAPGFRDRIDLYNLYPLLVHVNLFGGGYVSSVRQILRPFAP